MMNANRYRSSGGRGTATVEMVGGPGGLGTATVRCSLARKLALHRPLIGHCALRTQTTLRAATAIEYDIEKRKK